MDGAIFREWASLMAGSSDDLAADTMIAATAGVYGLVISTRNVKDFAKRKVRVFNPFSSK